MKSTGLIVAAVVLALVAGIVGYFIGAQNPDAPIVDEVTETAESTRQNITGFKTVLLGEQNESGQVGVATITEEGGSVKVNMQFVGAPEGSNQPAHIHSGSCPEPGPIVFPLTNVVDGNSETILNTTMDQLDSRNPLAINVHQSAEEIDIYIACGNLPD